MGDVPDPVEESLRPDEGRVYLEKTLQVTFWCATMLTMLLAGYGQWWAIGPFLTGVALGVVLLLALNTFVRRIFRPEFWKKKDGPSRQRTAIFVFALVKYPLVATLIWWIVGHWEPRAVMAFAGGFILLQAVIGLRAVGKALTDQTR